MKFNLRSEECLMFLLSIYLFSLLDFAWWWYPALILLPDIGMVGYFFNPKTGAILYNIFHHKGIALTLYLMGIFLINSWLILAGIILFGHSCMDRMFGFGLKYSDSFKNTHLGTI